MSRDRWEMLGALAIVVVLLLIAAAVPGLTALFFDLAWGLLAAIAVGVVVCLLADRVGLDGGGYVRAFGLFAVVIGLIVGMAWRLLG